MVINDRLKFLYIAIPRTASVASQESLMQLKGSFRFGGDRHYNQIPDSCRKYFIFSTVRNPYSREWSHYQKHLRDVSENHIQSHWTFEAYVRDHQQRGFDIQQHRVLRKANARILRYESLADEWSQLPFQPPPLKRRNRSRDRNWHGGYTQEIADLVHSWAEPDFDQYEYERGSWQKDAA